MYWWYCLLDCRSVLYQILGHDVVWNCICQTAGWFTVVILHLTVGQFTVVNSVSDIGAYCGLKLYILQVSLLSLILYQILGHLVVWNCVYQTTGWFTVVISHQTRQFMVVDFISACKSVYGLRYYIGLLVGIFLFDYRLFHFKFSIRSVYHYKHF